MYDPDLDPKQYEKSNSDPKKIITDPQHCHCFRLGSEVTNLAQLLKEAEDDMQKKVRSTRPKEGEVSNWGGGGGGNNPNIILGDVERCIPTMFNHKWF
jgi:hypothetical protein